MKAKGIVSPVTSTNLAATQTAKKGRARKASRTTPDKSPNNGFMTVKQLQRSKIPVVETVIDGHSLYLRPPSIKMTERIHESTSNLEGAQIVAEYLGGNLFNDELAIRPVGTVDEFKEGFSPVELIDLFQRLNEGLVIKKKAN